MQRKALYSRATRRRSAGPSVWVNEHVGGSGAPGGQDGFDQGPSAGELAWQRIKRLVLRHDRLALVIASVALSLGAIGGWSMLHPPAHALTQTDIDGAVQYTLAHTPRGPADTTRAAAIVAPSVVEVEGFLSSAHAAQLAAKLAREAKNGKNGKGGAPDHGPADGGRAPGLPDKPLSPETDDGGPQPDAIGSGVVVDQSGKILTALHVVSSTDRWVVVFADGSKSDADLIGAQPENDLAVLQPRHLPDELPPATLASTADLRPGDEVVATGFPFGIGPSVSAGVVSGLKREFIDPDNDRIKLRNLIQFDAAVNPGNSGGPLVDRDGEVVGIVTAILNPSGAHVFAGIGFAVPIENAMRAIGENPL